jgi:NADPH:quinone reductase-like Zn-dependent oxidoreductase
MKAVVFGVAGAPSQVLRVQDMEVPAPAAGEVLVKVDARPIQPADIMFIEGRYRWKPKFPQVAGIEGSGVIVAKGADVEGGTGTRVAFRHPGAWAEYIAVPMSRLYVVPDGIETETAAQFALNPPTAWALLDELHVQPGDWIAMNAATSNIAQLVHQLARRRDVGVVGIVRRQSLAKASFPAVADDEASLSDRLLQLAGGAPIAGFLDSIGGPALMSVLPALRQGATIVSYAVIGSEPAPMRNADLIYRNLCWKGFGLDHWLQTSAERRGDMLEDLWDAIRRGDVSLPVRHRYALADVHAAVTDASTNHAAGKILLEG